MSSLSQVGMRIDAEVSAGFAQLPGLRSAWEQVFVAGPNEPSTSFEWTSAMSRHHVQRADDCYLVTLRRDGVAVGFVPLVARQVPLFGQRVTLLMPISEDYNTHSDLLLADPAEEIVDAFIKALFEIKAPWDCFRMARLLEDSPLSQRLRRCLVDRQLLHHVRDGVPAYTLVLPATFQGYLDGRSAKFRNHLKRIERKVASSGAVRLRDVATSADLETAYDAVLQIERASWKEQHGTSIAAVERQTAFYRDFCDSAQSRGRLHLQWLTIDDLPVAYNLGYIRDRTYHYLKTSYAAAFRSISPATLLRARLIESLIDAGVRTLDFPGEPYEWEAQWTDTVRWRKVISVFPRTLRGRTLSLLEKLRHHDARERRVSHVDPRTSNSRHGAS